MAYGAQKVQVKFNSNRLTHFGGVYLFHLFLKQIGWRKFLTLNSGTHSERNNHYTLSEQIFSLLYPIILGISRIEISRMLGNNGVFKLLIGFTKFPNPTTLRRFLIRGSDKLLPPSPIWDMFRVAHVSVPQLVRLHDRSRKYFINQIVPTKKMLYDLIKWFQRL